MDRQNLYKVLRIPSVADLLSKRNENFKIERQEKQREYFWSKREQHSNSIPKISKPGETKQNLRLEMLKKWKAEKAKKLEEAKKNKKPVFRVGILQRKATGSPLLQKPNLHGNKPLANNENHSKLQVNRGEKTHGMVTRAFAKKNEFRGKAKPVNNGRKELQECKIKLNNKLCNIKGNVVEQVQSHTFKVPECVTNLPNPIKLTFPCSPQMFRRSKKDSSKKSGSTKKKEEYKTIKNTTPKEIKIYNEKVNQSINYSPFTKGGSEKKTKSCKKLYGDVSNSLKEDDEFTSKISSFREYIQYETKRLLESCFKWKHIYEECQEIPEEVEGDIDSLIGKTNLLTSDKFKQFEDLINKCANGDPLIKIDDLQGFQDWVSIEVERIDKQFHKLEMQKCNNWNSNAVEKEKTTQKANRNGNQPKKPVGKSNIRAHILAARKLLKEGKSTTMEVRFNNFVTEDVIEIATPKKNKIQLKDTLNSERKENNLSFSKSDKKTPNSKKRSSAIGVLAASQKSKFLTSVNDSLVTENVTPSRSIFVKTLRSVNYQGTFDKDENKTSTLKTFNEKFKEICEVDNKSSPRIVLKNLENLTPGILTRSRAKSTALRDSHFIDYGLK